MTAPRTGRSTKRRFRLSPGRTAISTDFDHPTLTGCDADHELAKGEAGSLRAATRTMD